MKIMVINEHIDMAIKDDVERVRKRKLLSVKSSQNNYGKALP